MFVGGIERQLAWKSHEKPYKIPFKSCRFKPTKNLPPIFNKTIFESDFPWNIFDNISKKARIGKKSQNVFIYEHSVSMLAKFATKG